MARSGAPVTDRARETFLTHFEATGNVSAAAREAGISRNTAYRWKGEDETFAEAWEEAEQTAIDMLEEVARSRAVDDKSDRMLEILLKAHRPEKYVEKRLLEMTGANGGPIETKATIDPGKLSTEALREIMEARSEPDAG